MNRCRTVTAAAVVVATFGMSLTGCSGGSSARATATVTATGSPTKAGTAGSAVATPTVVGDKQACLDMEKVLGEMSIAAAHWRPAAMPFDPVLATKIRLLADQMAMAERKTTSAHVRAGVHESTVAFASLARTMAGTKKTKVYAAVGRTRLAYGDLKRVCALG